MKDKRHIKSFNEATENLNISDVSDSFNENIHKIVSKTIKYIQTDIIKRKFTEEEYDNNYTILYTITKENYH